MNIFHGLLFQSGHIVDPQLALRLGRDESAIASVAPAPDRAPGARQRPSRIRWLFEELALLGGRPITKQHLDDLEEPFPDLHPCQ